MTTRQAKAAYRKSGGPHLSELERRQILRGAELAERAAKIKEKERNKKINKRKREEKEAQERERKRTCRKEDGLAIPVRWKSSQRGIGELLGKGKVDLRTEQDDTESRRDEVQHKTVVTPVQDVPVAPAPAAKDESQAVISRVPKHTPKSSSGRRILADLSPNTVRVPSQRLEAEIKHSSCPKIWDDDWATLLPSNTQLARELRSPEADSGGRRNLLLVQSPACTKSKTSTIIPVEPQHPTRSTSLSVLPCREPDLSFLSTQDLQFSEEDLKELAMPPSRLEATILSAAPPSICPSKNNAPGTAKRFRSPLAPKTCNGNARVHEKPLRTLKLPKVGTASPSKDAPAPAMNEYGMISTQDLLELDLDLPVDLSTRSRHSQSAKSSGNFGDEEITDEDLLGLDIPRSPSNVWIHQRFKI